MARGTLEVVRHRVVVLVAEFRLDQRRHHRRDPAELGVTEGVGAALVGEEGAVGMAHALGDHHHTVAVALHRVMYPRQEGLAVEGHFRQQDDVGRVALFLAGQPRGRGDPARVPAHGLEHEDLGGGLGHGAHVEPGLPGGHGDVLGHRAEAGAGVRAGEVVVHRLGDADTGHRVAQALADLRDLVGGVLGVAAAVVEEVADVVGLEDLDQALVLGAVLLQALELVACRAERPRRGVAQRGDGLGRLLAGVDELLVECPEDARLAGVDGADGVRVGARGLDDATGGGVDDGGHTA